MSISREGTDHVSIRIDEKLLHLSHTFSEADSCIFRVPYQLHKVNAEAYEPVTVAIGPYHRDRAKADFQEMEKHKLRYLQQVLRRQKETSVERYVMAIRELAERAWKCYAETIDLETDEFVEMMLLDGCFIIELFRKRKMKHLRDENDLIFLQPQIQFGLARDLILLENQLPFFVLVQFFNMTKVRSQQDNIIEMALYFLRPIMPFENLEAPNGIAVDDIKHLLGLVHESWCFSLAKSFRNIKDKSNSWEYINSATELQEAGVEFKKAKRSNSLDIKFINGVLEIPTLKVSEFVESPFRNVLAYEQYLPENNPRYVCDYIAFMVCLINSRKDVQLLRRCGIIINQAGDDAAVYSMLNEMTQFIVTSRHSNFSYSNVFHDVNEHCRRPQNIWMATLRRNYFNSPWAFVSFLAAIVLLMLTVMQTVFSCLSFVQHK